MRTSKTDKAEEKTNTSLHACMVI